MSLKDRLNTQSQNAINQTINEIKEEPIYYETNDIANNINSLGIIDTLLADDDINRIFIKDAKNIYIERKGKIHKSTSTFRDNVQYETIIKKYLQNCSFNYDKERYAKISHEKGINIEFILPPLSKNTTISIKVYKDKHADFRTLQENQAISKEVALILEALCSIKSNVLIIGEKNTLKTTLLSAMAKKIPSNYRGIIIDYSNEVENDLINYSNYDFSITTKENENQIYNCLNLSNPDKIFINDVNEAILNQIVKNNYNGIKNTIITLEAQNIENAIEKIAHAIVKYNSTISFEKAKLMATETFNVAILTKRDTDGTRKIASLSELKITPNKEYLVQDIFNNTFSKEIKSTGYVPDFYELIKLNSLSINSSIFDENYKHTYAQIPQDVLNIEKRNLNADILKKFKKDLPTQEYEEKKLLEKTKQEIIENIAPPMDENLEALFNQEENSSESELLTPDYNPNKTIDEIKAALEEDKYEDVEEI